MYTMYATYAFLEKEMEDINLWQQGKKCSRYLGESYCINLYD